MSLGVHLGHRRGTHGAVVAGHGAGGLMEVSRRRGRADGHRGAHGLLLQAAPHEEAQEQRHGDHQQGQQGKQRGVAAPAEEKKQRRREKRLASGFVKWNTNRLARQ